MRAIILRKDGDAATVALEEVDESILPEAEVTDERGAAVCRATATYRLLPKK